jgi:hypothetical protein
VRESIAQLENPDDFFTIEKLCKLRRATTEREHSTFFWFFGKFMDSVSGRRYWKRQKYKQLVSTECEKGGQSKLVTKSDEAFALLLFENYIDKWTTKAVTMLAPETDCAEQAGGSNEKSKQRGKFMGKKSGHCKYGGWCHEGTTRYNELIGWLVRTERLPQRQTWKRSYFNIALWNTMVVLGMRMMQPTMMMEARQIRRQHC